VWFSWVHSRYTLAMAPRPKTPPERKREKFLEKVRLTPDEDREYREAYELALKLGEAESLSQYIRKALRNEGARIRKMWSASKR
jgi:hypothetical protein